MWHALLWGLIALVAVPWTLVCIGLHAVLTSLDGSGGDVQAWMAWLEQWRIPGWLAVWLPMESVTALKAWLTMLGPWQESLLAGAPVLLGWLVPLVWIGWGLGLGVLVMLGVAGSVLLSVLRRRPPGVPPAAAAGLGAR
jgi:hypothetical protein